MNATNNLVEIDRDLCDGCGECLPSCAEGAIYLAEGRAVIDQSLCDGLLNCLGTCPKGALKVSMASDRQETTVTPAPAPTEVKAPQPTLGDWEPLVSWPIKLELVAPNAPFLGAGEFILAADCVAFADPNFRAGRTDQPVIIGCPKLNGADYMDKLATILYNNPGTRRVTVVMMSVPCCQGLKWFLERAAQKAGVNLTIQTMVVTQKGKIQTPVEA